MAGSFTWTGFDYKGEPNPYGWPDISNHTGLLDLCGFPKDKAYYFQSCWSKQPMVHLVPSSWNWPGKEGQNIRVIAFSNTQHVELFLNGRSLGTKDMPHDSRVEWQVPYQPGQLLAKGYGDGKIVQRGYAKPPSFHEQRLREMTVGRIFEVVTKGYGAMPEYAELIPPDDRWAIIAYVRALQFSRNVPADKLTDEDRRGLEAGGARGNR